MAMVMRPPSLHHHTPNPGFKSFLPSILNCRQKKPMKSRAASTLRLQSFHLSGPQQQPSSSSSHGGKIMVHAAKASSLQEEEGKEEDQKKRSMAAMGLIVGTAVGPGILALPSATMSAGLVPSTILIISCWLYVVSSVLLVAELTFGVMAEDLSREPSFTSIAVHTLGSKSGQFVALVYAMLNYSLLVSCISGLGSLAKQCMGPSSLYTLISPCLVAILIWFRSFDLIHGVNQILCLIMMISIGALVAMGAWCSYCSSSFLVFTTLPLQWSSVQALVPAIPLTVLTLGFHVITPVVCKVIGDPEEARRVILLAGMVPLAMVLSWNWVVLGLAKGSGSGSVVTDPIELLLSVSTFAGPAVRAFAFGALGTTLIGYALSFPKQLSDTVASLLPSSPSPSPSPLPSWLEKGMVGIVLLPPTVMAILHPGAFARALDFAGIYANCFLFGFLPPVMAWNYRRSRRESAKYRTTPVLLAPKGRFFLSSLIVISLFLGLRGPGT